jgi:hypothetical protein
MAANGSVILKFSDGTVSYLRNVITYDQETEILTDASGLVNQAGGLSAGQANQGKLLVAACAKVMNDTTATGQMLYCSIVGVNGSIIGSIQGGGATMAGMPMLKQPIRMQTGVKINIFGQLSSGAVQYGAVSLYCASGKVDIFRGLAIDDTDVPMLSVVSGSTIGESLVGQRVLCNMAVYGGDVGITDTGIADGVNAFFAEDAQGQLKQMMFASTGSTSALPTQWVEDTMTIVQNDTLTLRANV